MIATAAEFGRLVRERRIAKGWTQAQLAERCGTGARFIGDLEAGKPTIHLGKALAVAREVGVELVDANESGKERLPVTDDDGLDFVPQF